MPKKTPTWGQKRSEARGPGTVAIRLFPGLLKNPDLDLRYLIPDTLEGLSNSRLRIADDGYDYVEGNALELYLEVSNMQRFAEVALPLLRQQPFLGNDVLTGCDITAESNKGLVWQLHSCPKKKKKAKKKKAKKKKAKKKKAKKKKAKKKKAKKKRPAGSDSCDEKAGPPSGGPS